MVEEAGGEYNWRQKGGSLNLSSPFCSPGSVW